MTNYIDHYINAKRIITNGKELPIYQPATGEIIRHIRVADADVINQAVVAASQAYPGWSNLPPSQRAKLFFKYKVLLEAHLPELAKLITEEHGKSYEEALGSLQRGLEVVDFVCDIANHLKGDFSSDVTNNIDTYSIRQSLGVCIGVTPFNFPGMIPLWMFSMALACGNTFVLKPSEKDPSCALKLVELATEAGFPEGVLNLVNGDKETVDHLITHPLVNAVSFVGSSVVAKHVYETAIQHHKRVQAFGGAKNHAIVMPDADMEVTADALVSSAYGSAGERCMAISVVVAVGNQVADQLVEKMLPKIAAFSVAPLITKSHLEKVHTYIETGKNEGATLVIQQPIQQAKGHYLGACLFDHVKPNMKIYTDEIFGPVLCIVRVTDFDSALALVNQHAYGNGTAIFTRDGYLARAFAKQVQVGMVGINVPIPVPVGYHSFGGWKQSIFSDIGMYGMEGVRFFTKLKTITQRWYAKETI